MSTRAACCWGWDRLYKEAFMLGMIFTVLIGLLAVGGVVLAVVVKIKNRGKGCCGGCSGCKRDACPSRKK